MPTYGVAQDELSSTDPTLPTGVYDVVVVGAGPVGLATALGLRQRGIDNILVIDQGE